VKRGKGTGERRERGLENQPCYRKLSFFKGIEKNSANTKRGLRHNPIREHDLFRCPIKGGGSIWEGKKAWSNPYNLQKGNAEKKKENQSEKGVSRPLNVKKSCKGGEKEPKGRKEPEPRSMD